LLGGEQKKSEENEEGDQIADEEHGIEMSEDFEGETHDVEKNGESSDEDGESGDESENLKQEMGDVDGADETLDEKLWADSDEEDNNDKVIHHFIIKLRKGNCFKYEAMNATFSTRSNCNFLSYRMTMRMAGELAQKAKIKVKWLQKKRTKVVYGFSFIPYTGMQLKCN
jgi:hypothetical protein